MLSFIIKLYSMIRCVEGTIADLHKSKDIGVLLFLRASSPDWRYVVCVVTSTKRIIYSTFF